MTTPSKFRAKPAAPVLSTAVDPAPSGHREAGSQPGFHIPSVYYKFDSWSAPASEAPMTDDRQSTNADRAYQPFAARHDRTHRFGRGARPFAHTRHHDAIRAGQPCRTYSLRSDGCGARKWFGLAYPRAAATTTWIGNYVDQSET